MNRFIGICLAIAIGIGGLYYPAAAEQKTEVKTAMIKKEGYEYVPAGRRDPFLSIHVHISHIQLIDWAAAEVEDPQVGASQRAVTASRAPHLQGPGTTMMLTLARLHAVLT